MTRYFTSPHELARAAMDAAIKLGTVAHHSGASDELYRKVAARVRTLTGATRCTSPIAVELHDTSDGRVRAIVDTGAGYWDSIVPAVDATRIRARGELA